MNSDKRKERAVRNAFLSGQISGPDTQSGVGPDCKCVCKNACKDINSIIQSLGKADRENSSQSYDFHSHYNKPENQDIAQKRQ